MDWLHVAGTQLLTYNDVYPKRGRDGMRASGILSKFGGTAVHDHWKSSFTFDNCQHALCNAHHLRELQFNVEQYQQDWAQEMAQLLFDIKAEVENAPSQANSLLEPLLSFFEQRYDQLIEKSLAVKPAPPEPQQKKRGGKKQSPPKNLLDRLQTYKPEERCVTALTEDSRFEVLPTSLDAPVYLATDTLNSDGKGSMFHRKTTAVKRRIEKGDKM